MPAFTTETIIVAIEQRAVNTEEWKIGVSADPLHTTHAHHQAWRHWHAGSPDAAATIKQHFVQKGMQPDPDEIPGAQREYVYIY